MNAELTRPWFAHYEDFTPHSIEVYDKAIYALLDEAAARYPGRNALFFSEHAHEL